jgi:hypothetical protein
MKIRRFSELDLARFVTLTPDVPLLEDALRRYDVDGGSWPYEPVRASTPDILRATTPLYGPVAPVPWTNIEAVIRGACKHGEPQISSCVEVGHVLFDEAQRLGWKAVQYPMGRMPIGSNESVRYWLDLVIADGDCTFIPFIDSRRSRGVTSLAIQRVIFSMQHIWVRERNPDLATSRLGIIRFSRTSPRKMSVSFNGALELLSFEELDARVCLVYEAWERVLRTKPARARRTGTDDTPDFFEGE